VIIVSGGENFFLHLFGKAEAATTVFGIDIIDKPIIIKLEFLINLVFAAQTFIYVLLNGIVGIWTYGELPCRQRLRPTGGSHATRGCGLLVAARSSWKHVDGGRLR
jgi:hypothetical protein